MMNYSTVFTFMLILNSNVGVFTKNIQNKGELPSSELLDKIEQLSQLQQKYNSTNPRFMEGITAWFNENIGSYFTGSNTEENSSKYLNQDSSSTFDIFNPFQNYLVKFGDFTHEPIDVISPSGLISAFVSRPTQRPEPTPVINQHVVTVTKTVVEVAEPPQPPSYPSYADYQRVGFRYEKPVRPYLKHTPSKYSYIYGPSPLSETYDLMKPHLPMKSPGMQMNSQQIPNTDQTKIPNEVMMSTPGDNMKIVIPYMNRPNNHENNMFVMFRVNSETRSPQEQSTLINRIRSNLDGIGVQSSKVIIMDNKSNRTITAV